MKALILWLALASPAHAASLADGQACLARNDVACAEAVVEELGAADSRRSEYVRLAAETAFYAGRYPEAYELQQRAVELGWVDRWDDLGLYERTVAATEGWTQADRERFVVSYRPGVDAVLVDGAIESLAGAEEHIAPLLGGPPPGPVRIEIYPTGQLFTDASSLTKKDVQTTGVVALSKWSRLLLTSPRALGRGYAWQDTSAHEYIHLVVAYQTEDRAPVWLHEAIAKYLDNRWRDGSDGFRLSVRQRALMSEAVRTGEFVPYEQMHPSLAKLPSAELATLAYAQLSTLMAYAFQEGGEDVLVRALPLVRSGVDPFEALAQAAGFKSFQKLEKGWREYVKTLDLSGEEVAEMPTVLDGGDAVEADPVLSQRADLARWVRLGDLLAEKGRYQAALIEYAKAESPDEPPSPLLDNRAAQAYLALGDTSSARVRLEGSLEHYPEFPLTHKTLGAIHRKDGRLGAAIVSYTRAVELNPFDREVQEVLAELHAATGETALAQRHERYVQILKRGGEG